MTIKLNSFILTDDVINKMKSDVEYSRSNGVEAGFNLCTENSGNTLHDESHCTGAECSVDIPKKCKKGKSVGNFHTHTSSDSEPSIQDMASAYLMGTNCIGSIGEKDIKCYVRKDKNYSMKELETIVTALLRYEDPLHISDPPKEEDIENYKKWNSVRNELKKHYFNTIDVK